METFGLLLEAKPFNSLFFISVSDVIPMIEILSEHLS